MKFTVLGHACLYIEHKEIRFLIDPWLIGSCYWRSWWNYPEVSQDLVNNINPTHIYLTHLHWDHYHGPTLRKFQDSNPKILVAAFCKGIVFGGSGSLFLFSNHPILY